MKHWLAGAALWVAMLQGAWAQGLIMGVSEGTSGGLDHAQVIAKYQGLADVVGRAIKQKVNVVFAREFSALEEGMKTGRYDFVIARPSDYPARGLRDYGYRYGRDHIDLADRLSGFRASPMPSLAEASALIGLTAKAGMHGAEVEPAKPSHAVRPKRFHRVDAGEVERRGHRAVYRRDGAVAPGVRDE